MSPCAPTPKSRSEAYDKRRKVSSICFHHLFEEVRYVCIKFRYKDRKWLKTENMAYAGSCKFCLARFFKYSGLDKTLTELFWICWRSALVCGKNIIWGDLQTDSTIGSLMRYRYPERAATSDVFVRYVDRSALLIELLLIECYLKRHFRRFRKRGLWSDWKRDNK